MPASNSHARGCGETTRCHASPPATVSLADSQCDSKCYDALESPPKPAAAMKPTIRASNPADAAAITAVLSAAGLSPNAEPQQLHWKYWQEREDSPGPRSYVVTKGSDIIAHVGLVPATSTWRTRRVRLVQMIDWAARPAEIGAGVMLLKHVSRFCDAIVSVGGSAHTLRILPRVGFRSRGCIIGYVRTLHPLHLVRNAGNSGWRLLPRFLRSGIWAITAPQYFGGDWQVQRIFADKVPSVLRVLPTSTDGMTVLERSEGMFSYALTCPIAAMELHALERAGHPRGYFVLALVPAQARLADCWIDSGDPTEWRALVQCAVREAGRKPGVAELVAWANDPMLSGALRECGFHERRALQLQLLANDSDAPTEILRVQMLDSDAAYHHESRPDLWA